MTNEASNKPTKETANAAAQPWWHYRPSTQRGKSWFASGLVLFAALLISTLIMVTGPSSKVQPPQEKAWPVSTLQVSSSTIEPRFRAFGKVASRAVAKLSTDISATVAKVAVSEGQTVSKGDLLVALDDAEYQLRLVEAEADLAQQQANLASMQAQLTHVKGTRQQHENMNRIASAKLARHNQLMQDRLISRSLYDEAVRSASQVSIEYQRHQQQLAELPHRVAAAKAQVTKAKALLSRAELNVSKTQILAPFAGPVLSVNAAVGDRMLPGTVVVTLADAQAFELRIPMPEAYVGRLQQALSQQSAPTIQGATDQGQVFTLSRLAGVVSNGQSGVDAFFALQTELGAALPVSGQVLELEITLPAMTQVVALPPQAIYENQRVYRVIDNRLQPINIQRVGETRNADGEYQVLVSAPMLSNGQRIITTQLPKAIQGLLVQPTTQNVEISSRSKAELPSRATTKLTTPVEPMIPKIQNQLEPAVLEHSTEQVPQRNSSSVIVHPTLV
jgi:multidrug efflux pump subunit AcrA (membrane-fusion protein)